MSGMHACGETDFPYSATLEWLKTNLIFTSSLSHQCTGNHGTRSFKGRLGQDDSQLPCTCIELAQTETKL